MPVPPSTLPFLTKKAAGRNFSAPRHLFSIREFRQPFNRTNSFMKSISASTPAIGIAL